VSVDLSAPAIDAVARNLARNAGLAPVAACRHRGIVGDAFEVMDRLARDGERFDVVVVDPPSFASKRASVPGALRAYGRLTRAAVALVRPGGTLVQASCSSRVSAAELLTVVRDNAGAAGAHLSDVEETGQPLDHPVGFAEGAYLKAVFAVVGR
jgi:23S rRNA (cytosine1962-C5)-methyltransferase